VLSCVRSSRGLDKQDKRKNQIGFLKDARRMNVSITRARSSVYVLGHADTLRTDPLWNAVLQDANDRGCLVTAQSPPSTWFEAARKEASVDPDADGAAADGQTAAEAASTAVVQRAPEIDASAVSSPGRGTGRGKRATKASPSSR